MTARRLDERQAVEAYGTGKRIVEQWHVDNGDPWTAVDDAELPAKGAAHPDKPNLRVQTLNARRLTRSLCEVEVTYGILGTTGPSERTKGEIEEEIEFEMVEEQVTKDISGAPIPGAMNAPSLIGLTVRRPRVVYVVRRWQATLGLTTILAKVGKVNNQPFLGQPAKTWLMLPASARRYSHPAAGESSLWEVTLRFSYAPETWKKTYSDENSVEKESNVYNTTNLNVFLP